MKLIEWNLQLTSDILRYCPGWLSALWLASCTVFTLLLVSALYGALSLAQLSYLARSFWFGLALTALCSVWAWWRKIGDER